MCQCQPAKAALMQALAPADINLAQNDLERKQSLVLQENKHYGGSNLDTENHQNGAISAYQGFESVQTYPPTKGTLLK